MPPAKVYRIDHLKPKGYLSQIDDLSDNEQALLEEQRETSRRLFRLMLSEEEAAADELSGRRLAREEESLRRRVQELSQAVEAMFASRGRQAYMDITGYTERALLLEARGEHPTGHTSRFCYLCEPMRTLGWSRRRALGEATFSLFLGIHGSKLQGGLLDVVKRCWKEAKLGPFNPEVLAKDGFPVLLGVVRESVTALVKDVFTPHLASWRGISLTNWAMGSGERYLMAESIARLLLKNSGSNKG
ncbi:MAG: hypothetical protein V2A77_00145 [Pseudomonadota bacterium]